MSKFFFLLFEVNNNIPKHFLEFWNHGGAYYGFGVDEDRPGARDSAHLLSLKGLKEGVSKFVQPCAKTALFSKFVQNRPWI